jgi:hypothetical protein
MDARRARAMSLFWICGPDLANCRSLRNSNLPATSATNQHDGQINSDYQKLCQDNESKINHWPRRANQEFNSARLPR